MRAKADLEKALVAGWKHSPTQQLLAAPILLIPA
jgi:hypothetical protein